MSALVSYQQALRIFPEIDDDDTLHTARQGDTGRVILQTDVLIPKAYRDMGKTNTGNGQHLEKVTMIEVLAKGV